MNRANRTTRVARSGLKTSTRISMRKAIANRLLPRHSPFLERLNWSARWVASVRGSESSRMFAKREDMYEHLNREYFADGGDALDFLEFGVHLGQSLERWCSLNSSVDSRFYGFDSFEGLPEDWNDGAKRGAYSAGGHVPQIEDPRVEFVTGWFQDTLPTFLRSFRPRSRLLIHNDCDLYSSTLYSLTMLNSIIVSGTIIMFDEFYDAVNEYRALHDYATSYRRRFKIVSHTSGFTQAAIEVL